MKRKVQIAAVALAATFALTSCASATPSTPTSSPEVSDICGDASGAVTWYTSLEAAAGQPIIDAFQAACPGVTINFQGLAGSFAIWERFQQEANAGLKNADVLSMADWGLANEAASKDLVAPLPEEILADYPEDFKDPDGYWFSARILSLGISYNTNQIDEADAPTSWDDLLDPAYKGKIAILDPRKNAGGYTSYWQLQHTEGLGDEFLEALAAQEPAVFGQSGQLVTSLVSGEYALGITTDDASWGQIEVGAPLAVVSPEEGSASNRDQNLLVKDAPNPEGAKAFLAFLASPAGGEIVAQQTLNLNPLPGVPAFPEGRENIDQIKLLIWDPAQQTADKPALTEEIVTMFNMGSE